MWMDFNFVTIVFWQHRPWESWDSSPNFPLFRSRSLLSWGSWKRQSFLPPAPARQLGAQAVRSATRTYRERCCREQTEGARALLRSWIHLKRILSSRPLKLDFPSRKLEIRTAVLCRYIYLVTFLSHLCDVSTLKKKEKKKRIGSPDKLIMSEIRAIKFIGCTYPRK